MSTLSTPTPPPEPDIPLHYPPPGGWPFELVDKSPGYSSAEPAGDKNYAILQAVRELLPLEAPDEEGWNAQEFCDAISAIIQERDAARAEVVALRACVADVSTLDNKTLALDACRADVERLNATVDRLLAHCLDGECEECGKAVCPHGDPLHFHHDGCPSCAMAEERLERPVGIEPTTGGLEIRRSAD